MPLLRPLTHCTAQEWCRVLDRLHWTSCQRSPPDKRGEGASLKSATLPGAADSLAPSAKICRYSQLLSQ